VRSELLLSENGFRRCSASSTVAASCEKSAVFAAGTTNVTVEDGFFNRKQYSRFPTYLDLGVSLLEHL